MMAGGDLQTGRNYFVLRGETVLGPNYRYKTNQTHERFICTHVDDGKRDRL
jgi:hypothetical protein